MNQLYFNQLLAGVDLAVHDSFARDMRNFIYLLGDREKKECVVVDPAWDIEGIIRIAQADNMRIVGALATHSHPDHVGGDLLGRCIEGLSALMAVNPCKVHAHKKECPDICLMTGLAPSDMVAHACGDKIQVGNIEIKLLHTPGHTPGSACFCFEDKALLSGDTLFLQGCGRVDLPGGDAHEMWCTLHQRLKNLPGFMSVYPGHAYAGTHASLSFVRSTNYVFQPGAL